MGFCKDLMHAPLGTGCGVSRNDESIDRLQITQSYNITEDLFHIKQLLYINYDKNPLQWSCNLINNTFNMYFQSELNDYVYICYMSAMRTTVCGLKKRVSEHYSGHRM